MPVAVAKLTWDDIKDWPETRVELVDGEAIFQPVPSINHQRICQNLGNAVLPYVESNRLGEFSFHPIHIILDPGVEYEPDCCFIAAGRDTDPNGDYFRGAPDMIAEVVSESNRSHDTVVKFRDYERFGVREYWLVDPRALHVRIFHLDEAGKYECLGVFSSGETINSRLFPDLVLDPASLFGSVTLCP